MAQGQISVSGILKRQPASRAGIPVVIALIAGGVSVYHFQQSQGFESDGAQTTAVIQRQWVTTHASRDGAGRTRRYHFRYEYETGDGDVINGSTRVSQGYYRDVNEGERVTVTYMPDDPQVVEVEGGRSFTGALFFGVPAALSAIVAAFVGWRSWRSTAAMLRAGRRGERRSAKVIEHAESRAKMGDDPMFWRLLWRDHTGAEGHSLWHDGAALDRWAPQGSEIHVHVDPVSGQAFWARDIFGR